MQAKDLDLAIVILTRGTKMSSQPEDLRGHCDVAERGWRNWWQRYFVALRIEHKNENFHSF